MDVKEMHIEIEQATQNLAANARRKFYPDEIDWILNKTVHRYIGSHVGDLRKEPGAADSLVHLNRLSTLLDKTDVTCYDNGDTLKTNVAAVIPYHVQEVLSVEAHVHNLCGASPKTLREAHTLHYLKIVKSNANTEWYKSVVLSVNAEPVFNITAHAADRGVTFNGFSSKNETWRLVPILMAELRSKGYEVHWETYGDIHKPDTIIFSGLPTTVIQILIDGVTTVATYEDTLLRTKYINSPLTLFPGRFYFQTVIPQMTASGFASTYYRSPLCYQENDKVVTELDNSFIVSGVRLYHVRRPRMISLSLEENCELPENVHSDICDLAIEYIKGLRADPDWENKLRDNMTRTTI
jgi:hypothetical protein